MKKLEEVEVQKLTEQMVAIAKELEPKLPEGYTFALFVYEKEPELGHVAALSRNRVRCAQAVAAWLVQNLPRGTPPTEEAPS